MKTIKDYILERFVSSNKTDILSVLNKDISTVNDLKPILKKYFEQLNYTVKISKTFEATKKWTVIKHSKIGVYVEDYFNANISKPGDKYKYLLRIGRTLNAENRLSMQLLYCSNIAKHDNWSHCAIHGAARNNLFKIGVNFLEYMLKIKESNDDNSWYDKDPLIVNLFFKSN